MFKRMNAFYGLLVIFLAMGCSAEAPKATYKEGTHFKKVSKVKEDTDKDSVSVIEFFSYGCPHCYHLEHTLKAWDKTKPSFIQFKRMPAYWNPFFETMAATFYTAELLKVTDKVHEPLFKAIHEERRPLRDMYAVKAFFQERGIDGAKFEKTFNSFAVKQKLKMSDSTFRNFKLSSVPSIVVGGTYSTDVSMAGSEEELGRVINFLAEKVKNER